MKKRDPDFGARPDGYTPPLSQNGGATLHAWFPRTPTFFLAPSP